MSRTYRRKNSGIPKWVTSRLIYNGNRSEYINLEGKDREVAISKYYSDICYSSKPWVTRRVLEHRQRSKNKLELDNINKKGYYDEYEFTPILKQLKGRY